MSFNFSLSQWQLFAWVIGITLVTPLCFLLFESLQGDSDVFSHLWSTVLWDYTRNTLLLILGVCAVSCTIALPLAWLTAYCDFPGRKHFEWALMLPLAMPTYIIAYVYTDLFDYAGPIQIALRNWFGWQSPDDYWFFDMRTLEGAIMMIALVLYPYLYLIFKTALREQSFKLVQASQIMGLTPIQSFYRVSLPLARGAIVAGLTLISMETMADFATVNYFAVSTLTTAVYDTWLGYYSLTAAAKISGIMLFILFLVLTIERFSRRKQAVFERQSGINSETLYVLKGKSAWWATSFCCAVLFFAFVLPVAVLLKYAIAYAAQAWNDAFFLYAWQSFKVAGLVSVVTVILSLLIVFYQRIGKQQYLLVPGRLASTGYALPGTVLAIAVLLPLTVLDDRLNALLEPLEIAPGLLFSGTLFAIIFAYVVRFYAIAHGAIEASFMRISPSLDMASQSMGKSHGQTLRKVHIPLLRRGILTAGLLVFIECMKELPAALLLRPFNFETLATHVFQYVSDEQLELASISALAIVVVGLVPLYFVNRSMEQRS